MPETATWKESRPNGPGESYVPGLSNVRSELHDIDEQVRSFVREKPLAALGIAIVAGYLVGRVLSRF